MGAANPLLRIRDYFASAHSVRRVCRVLDLFSFAVAALIEGRWTLLGRAGTSLDVARVVVPDRGIALGNWWAYYELGWGSWWYWDPVENASFMPWLVVTS